MQRSAPTLSNLQSIEATVQKERTQLVDHLHAVWGERTLLKVHAKGFDPTLGNRERLVRHDQTFRLTAELMLFQHSCHGFCRSRSVAAARLTVQA